MNRRVTMVVGWMSALCASVALAAELPPATAISPQDISAYRFYAGRNAGTNKLVDVTGQSFTRAAHVEVGTVQQPWDVQLLAGTTGPIAKGDVLLVSFWIRAVEGMREDGEARALAVLQKSGAPHTKYLYQQCNVGREWKQFQLPLVSKEAFAAGEASVGVMCGFGPQKLEVAAIELRNFGSKVKVESLPRTRFPYRGQEPQAAWRKEALERIEKIRKAELVVEVTDAAGKPAADATVRVRMVRHGFAFGSAVAADQILAQTPDAEKYRQTIQRLFNRVVMENDLKWGMWERNRERSIAGVDWLRSQGIEVRGHCLVWPSWRNTPRELQKLADQPEALRKRIDDHILDEAGAMKGKLVEWDVINEPFSEKDVMKVLGDEEMVRWFKLARQADAGPRLFLNDYPIMQSGPGAHIDHFERTIRFLIDKGAPIGGIGVQAHYGSNPAPPVQVLAGLDRFAKFNLPIAITEFDVNTTDEAMQADYVRDHTIACFSHPAVESILMWGFWEGRHWIPNAALYRKDWSVKPAGTAFEDLVLKQWWTDQTVKTDATGKAKLRGFLGDYEVQVVGGGGESQKVRIGRDGAAVRVKR